MAVAVRLVEALTLITVLGVLMACTVIIVIAERVFRLLMFLLYPICGMLLWATHGFENLLVWIVNVLLCSTYSLGYD